MQRDLTKGAEGRVILAFALPIMGSMLLQTAYTLVDSVIVGNFIGATALGAVGLTGPVTWLVTIVATALGTGTSIAFAQYIGAGRGEDVKRMLATVLILAALVGVVITAAGIALAKPLIWGFLGAPEDMRQASTVYFRILCTGAVFQVLYNAVYGVLRAHGDSKGAVLFLLVAAILNIVLDLLFVVGLGLGVTGAAWATVISQAGSAVAAGVYLWRFYPHMRMGVRGLVLDRRIVSLLMGLSVPVMLQSSVSAVGFMLLQRLVNGFGDASIEGFAAMQKVENLIHIPSNAFNTAMANFVGQNIGAGKLERIRRGYNRTLAMSCGCCVALVILVLLFGKHALGLFNIEGEALRRGQEHLNLLSLFMMFYTVNHVTAGLLQGAGDVRVPAVTSLVNLTIRISSAYLMAATWIGYRSVYLSLPLAWTTACIITQVRYRSGKWKGKTVLS